jgi:hypothetical protein
MTRETGEGVVAARLVPRTYSFGMGRTRTLAPLSDRFWARVDSSSPDSCWPWPGSRSAKGYGRVNAGGQSMFAHRLAFELANSTLVPHGQVVMHSCDNPPCCNPAHLRIGTYADNSADMVAKGRSANTRGERSGKAKLTDAQVADLRRRYAAGEFLTALARELGISKGYAGELISGRRRGNGVPVISPHSTDGIAEEAIRLYQLGLSTIKVGSALGRNPAVIYRVLVRHGVQMRSLRGT